MIAPLISPDEFMGLDGTAHLCAGGEAPMLRSHLVALGQFAADKSAGMAGRERMFAVYRQAKRNLSWLVQRPESDIALLGSASEGVNVVGHGMEWRSGDNVVLADVEFPSLIYPWTRFAERGVELRIVPTRRWILELADLRRAVDERTRLVAISQVSYLTGQRHNLAAVADIAWQVGARLLVDATHALGVVPVNANLCDFLVSSCYKWLLATHGVGVFVWNRSRVPDLPVTRLGWHSVAEHSPRTRPAEVVVRPDADRFEIGNPAFPGVYVLNNALERLAQLDERTVEGHVLRLTGLLRRGLVDRGRPVVTPDDESDRAGNVCFTHPAAELLVSALANRGVLVWGSEGRVRVSAHVYNSTDDLARFFAALDEVASGS